MTKPTIDINVSGIAGSGKTTVEAVIRQALVQHGFTVETVNDPDYEDGTVAHLEDIVDPNGDRSEQIAAVAHKTSVRLRTTQLRRNVRSLVSTRRPL